MRILFWHGYLLGGTGSKYLHPFAGPGSGAVQGTNVTVFSPGARPWFLRSRRGGGRVRPGHRRSAAGVRGRSVTTGQDVRLLSELTAAECDHYVAVNAAGRCARYLPGRIWSSSNHVLMGGAGRCGPPAARYAVKAHGLRAWRYAMRGHPGPGPVGPICSRRRVRCLCGFRAHRRRAHRDLRPDRASARGTARRRCRGNGVRGSRGRGPRRAAGRGPARRTESGQPGRAVARRRQRPNGSPSSSPTTGR